MIQKNPLHSENAQSVTITPNINVSLPSGRNYAYVSDDALYISLYISTSASMSNLLTIDVPNTRFFEDYWMLGSAYTTANERIWTRIGSNGVVSAYTISNAPISAGAFSINAVVPLKKV